MYLMMFTLAEAGAAPVTGGGSPFGQLGVFALLFAVMYFVMIRPQQRREKARKAMVAAVKSGDRVMLTCGFIGQVTSLKETTLIVRIADNTKVEVVKSAISQVLEKGETPADIEPAGKK